MRLAESTMLEVQPRDKRGFFILPQAPEDAGYYVYGTPGRGAGKYAHPNMMMALLYVEREWQAVDAVCAGCCLTIPAFHS
ncbi:hypothetical protein CSQ95_18775 [Janthinobacterium sp. BJB304]|nr:hypothetical protein CSQ95_18775 [Janthinobacterium sp. BJB304]